MNWLSARRASSGRPAQSPDIGASSSPPSDSTSAALEALVARFSRLMHYVAVRHGLANDDVEEVVQEVRVRLWRARPQGETIAGLGVSYVYRTAMSAALEVVRRRRGPGTVVSLGDRGDEAEDDGPLSIATAPESGPEHALDRSELAHAVSQAVSELPDARRTVVRLYLVGYTRDEIAHMLSWSEAKTRNLIYADSLTCARFYDAVGSARRTSRDRGP